MTKSTVKGEFPVRIPKIYYNKNLILLFLSLEHVIALALCVGGHPLQAHTHPSIHPCMTGVPPPPPQQQKILYETLAFTDSLLIDCPTVDLSHVVISKIGTLQTCTKIWHYITHTHVKCSRAYVKVVSSPAHTIICLRVHLILSTYMHVHGNRVATCTSYFCL